MQSPLFIRAHVLPKFMAEQENSSLGESAELSSKEGIQPGTQITRSGRIVQDAACYQDVPGIGSIYFEAAIQPNRHDVFCWFTDKPPTISSSVELITSVFAFYEQEGTKPLQVWTDSSTPLSRRPSPSLSTVSGTARRRAFLLGSDRSRTEYN